MAVTKVSTELLKDGSVTINKLHSDTVITVPKGLHNHVNDNGIPTAGAVAAYVSSQVAGSNNWDLAFGWGDHSTYGYATETYVNNSIANVINSAPTTLDTLNELAAALGDDPNFATTVSTQIGTAQSTANTALTNANAALAKDPTLTISGDASGSATFTNLGNATLSLTIADDSHNHIISNIDGLQTALDGKQAAGTYNTIIGTDSDINTSGATIVDNIYVTDGVITSMGTRTLTLGDLGYTGATNANYITNNNQLTNGAGYISTGSTVLSQASWTNATKFKSAGDINQAAGNHSLQIYSDINNDAFMAFHISADYAVHFGLDNATNRLHVGGWSDSSKYQIWDSRDFSSTNISNWNTAYGWGNHASAGYVTASHTHTWANISGETANSVNDWGGLRHQTNDGYIDFGPANSSHAHIYTDRPNFYFNKPLTVSGGSLINSGDIRSAIFYDSNNTAYYTNPAGTSRLNASTSNYVNLEANNAYALRFWSGSNNYSIRMAQSANGTYGGRVGGETTSDYNMYFTMNGGTNRGFVFNNGLANAVAGIDASGNGRFEGDVVAFSASDKRLKDNIKPIENALEKVNKISGVEFDWNSNQDTYAEGMHDIGVIAQEIEEVIPEVVKTRDNGYKAVKYEKIVPLLIEAIKEQQAQIEELKQLINKQ